MFLKKLLHHLRGEFSTEELIKNGMKVGKNFSRQNNVIIDPGHCWLIEIGDNVTLAPRVMILCHDASTKYFLGYAKIGKVKIGNNVFVGANTTILPGVTIGDNVVIGANSTVTKDIPNNSLAVGSPVKVLSNLDDYLNRMKELKEKSPVYGEEWTVRGGITEEKKNKMKKDLEQNKIGFVK